MTLGLYISLYRKDITNFSFLRHRRYDGFIVTMHQSGTHWLKHMLASAIAHEKNLEPPKYSYAGDMIGGNKDPVIKYEGIPLLGHSHNVPSFLITSTILNKLVKQPKYVILVRDIRHMLISNYEKHKHEYGCSFSELVRGDVKRKRFGTDVWWCIRFQNAWGRFIDRYPERSLLIKYEDMTTNTLDVLMHINKFLELNLNESSLRKGIEESTKEKMRKKPQNPKYKMKNVNRIIRTNKSTLEDYFREDDLVFLRDTCTKYLKYDFGYKY